MSGLAIALYFGGVITLIIVINMLAYYAEKRQLEKDLQRAVEKTEEPKPLTTNKNLSKKQLIEYLRNADIPYTSADLTLQFDEETGQFYLFFYWSEGPGAFGQRIIDFDIESPELIKEACFFNELVLKKPAFGKVSTQQIDGKVNHNCRMCRNHKCKWSRIELNLYADCDYFRDKEDECNQRT